jgi:hypothetical protein
LPESFEQPFISLYLRSTFLSFLGNQKLTVTARQFKEDVKKRVEDLKLEGRLNDQLLTGLREGYLAISLRFYFGFPLRRDLDGG